MKTYSILRIEQYKKIKSVSFHGKVLDLGGSKKSGYHELMHGQEEIVTGNIDASYGCDIVFDVQNNFPFGDNTFDGITAINLFEHVYNVLPALNESARVLKPGGIFVITTPFMVNIHGSPDDFFRYTGSFYQKKLAELGLEVERIEVLGFGLFSLIFQTCGGSLPSNRLRLFVKDVFVGIDRILLRSNSYRRLCNRIPLGYFVVAKKKYA